jgi:hypothetical protein
MGRKRPSPKAPSAMRIAEETRRKIIERIVERLKGSK